MATRHWLNRIGIAPLFALMFGVGAATLVAAMLPDTFAAFVHAVGLAPVDGRITGASRALAMLAAFVAVALPVGIATAVFERALWPHRPDVAVSATLEDGDTLDLEPFAEPVARGPIFADRDLGAPLMSDDALRTALPLREATADTGVEAQVAAPQIFTAQVEVPAAPDLAEPVQEEPQLSDTQAQALSAPVVEASVAAAEDEREQERVGEILAAPLVVREFDLALSGEPGDSDEPQPGESSIEALIRRLESGLARRDPSDPATPHLAAVLRSEINRAAPVAAARTGKPDDATARALRTLRQMAGGAVAG